MKYFISLLAVALTASAFPAEVFKDASYLVNLNGTRVPQGQIGWATVAGGTHGGWGGPVWNVHDPWALRNAINTNERRFVRVHGRIDLLALFTASPGVSLRVGNWKTLVGVNRNAEIFGGGIQTRGYQVIIQNIRFTNALNFAPGERPNGQGGIVNQVNGAFSTIDSIDIGPSVHVWVDHCEFSDDPWNSANTPENRRRHDGQIDITRGSNYVSVSNSIFRNHNHVSLVGNSDNNGNQDRGRLKTTFYFNWFQGVNQRNPRVRFGEVHVLNNLYTSIRSYGIGVGVSARIFAERNVFVNTRRSWGWAAGVPNPMGYLVNFNNLLQNSQHDSGISGNGVTWRPVNHYTYRAMAAQSVEAHVRRNAGPR